MDIIRFTIENPVKVAVGVILACLFGLLALFQIPIQLTPDVDEPIVTVTTLWPGKSVREVEREIVDRQEEQLKGVSGLRKMTSESTEGRAVVTLEFFVGVDKDVALRETDQKMNQVTGYPPDVQEPVIEAADPAMSTPIAWILFRAQDGSDVSKHRDFVWDHIKPILERVEGLSSVDVYGGREREAHVLIDPARLAARGLTMRDLENALRSENVNVSAGTITVGKRDFIYRTVGEFEDTAQIENTVIAYREGGPVYVHDVGRAVRTYEKQRSFVRSKGQSVLAMPARRETGSNVITVMEGLKEQINLVNEDILHARGLELELTQVYDETIYIRSSINLVRNNIFIGGALATIVLLAFLRNIRATGVVALSIPISVIATFLAVAMLGRNINVVMLAGMAFAVGMVVDNAVVVLENIYRHKQMGKPSFQAALDGGREVWGAILASTMTTMAVFLPVIFVEEEAGQLFRDIAIAIAAGVLMSLLVAVLVIPTVSARVLGKGTAGKADKESTGRIAHAVGSVVGWVNRKRLVQVALIVVFVIGSVGGSYLLMPPSDYLPSGNRNIVFGFIITEPGLSIEEFQRISYEMEDHLRVYWETEPGSPEYAALPQVMMPFRDSAVPVKPALIDNFFFVSFANMAFVGVTSRDDRNVAPLRVILQEALANSPTAVGAGGFFQQAPLFGGRRSGNTVDVEIRGSILADVERVAGRLVVECASRFGYARPVPSNFDLPRPERRAEADRAKAADLGMTVRDVGFIVEASVDGSYIGGFREEGDQIDLRIKLENADGTPIRDVAEVPLYTPTGRIVPLSSVVRFEEVGSPQQINHIESMPGITLEILAPPGMAIEQVMNTIDQDIIAPLRAEGAVPPGVYVSLAGTADKLVETRAAMFGHWTGWNLSSFLSLLQSRGFLALLVIYLLMAALFESFIHPLAIMLTVPLATVGGFAGLAVIHWLSTFNPIMPIQQLDVVTMLGFVILVGIVVNNAILIVHQTLNNINYGMAHDQGLVEAVRTRVRPILMTAFTSIGGMLPLALMPGAGSELYRGLAGVMVGGLFVATLFTLILVPVVFALFLELQMKLRGRVGRGVTVEEMAAPAPAEPRRPAKRAPAPSEPAVEVAMSGRGASGSKPSGEGK